MLSSSYQRRSSTRSDQPCCKGDLAQLDTFVRHHREHEYYDPSHEGPGHFDLWGCVQPVCGMAVHEGRGLHSFTSTSARAASCPTYPNWTHETVPNVLKLSSHVIECKTLHEGRQCRGCKSVSCPEHASTLGRSICKLCDAYMCDVGECGGGMAYVVDGDGSQLAAYCNCVQLVCWTCGQGLTLVHFSA